METFNMEDIVTYNPEYIDKLVSLRTNYDTIYAFTIYEGGHFYIIDLRIPEEYMTQILKSGIEVIDSMGTVYFNYPGFISPCKLSFSTLMMPSGKIWDAYKEKFREF